MKRNIVVNEYYRHFKNRWYKVLYIAKHTETEEKLVIYQAMYGNEEVFARPYDNFLEKVPKEKENPTGQEYRFMSMQELGLNLNLFANDKVFENNK